MVTAGLLAKGATKFLESLRPTAAQGCFPSSASESFPLRLLGVRDDTPRNASMTRSFIQTTVTYSFAVLATGFAEATTSPQSSSKWHRRRLERKASLGRPNISATMKVGHVDWRPLWKLRMNSAKEINSARSSAQITVRPTVAALEDILFKPIPVLDHGFIRVVDYMGDDASVVQASRVSYGRGTRKVQEDRGPNQLLDAPFSHHPIRDGGDQTSRQTANFCRAPVDQVNPRQRILPSEAREFGSSTTTNRQGRGAVLEGDQAANVLALNGRMQSAPMNTTFAIPKSVGKVYRRINSEPGDRS